jgi:hypothetical protein
MLLPAAATVRARKQAACGPQEDLVSTLRMEQHHLAARLARSGFPKQARPALSPIHGAIETVGGRGQHTVRVKRIDRNPRQLKPRWDTKSFVPLDTAIRTLVDCAKRASIEQTRVAWRHGDHRDLDVVEASA